VSCPSFRPLVRVPLALLLTACTGSEGGPQRTLRLERMDPTIKEGVFLNEPLTFHFSADVDPLSISRESVVIETEQHERARGRLSVEGRRVVFRPDVPHAQDLSDGGFRPGAQYRVWLAGFPRPDGIRGAGGEPLAETLCREFTAVAVDAPRRKRLFDDPHQERRKPPDLFPGAPGNCQVDVGEALYLACEKQIDPTSVRPDDFVLWREPTRDEPGRNFDLFARIVENEPDSLREPPRGMRKPYGDESWRTERRAALIELTPVRPLAPGKYVLYYSPPEPLAGEEPWLLCDFSLRPLFPGPHRFGRTIQVVQARGSAKLGAFVEDFVDEELRAPIAVPDCDGTAAWDGTGRVEVHYPLAAGDGSADAVSLGSTESRTDLQATRIDLAEGTTCRLPGAPGLVVLRAQGRISLHGILERDSPFKDVLDCGEPVRGLPLSQWLARAQAANPSWTVIIAGGDIVIDKGEIRSKVPVLLVAGGQVRDSGRCNLPEGNYWFQSGVGSVYTPGPQKEALFELDPPLVKNPLRVPLRFAVVSGPLPRTGRVARWISANSSGGFEPLNSFQHVENVKSDRTLSSFSVHYFPADAPQVPDFSTGPTSPVFLQQPDSVRFVVELVVGNCPYWEAPFVDRVQLEFEQAPQ